MWETPTGVPGIDALEEECAVHSFGQNRVLGQICSVENRMQATSVMKLTIVMLSRISHISVLSSRVSGGAMLPGRGGSPVHCLT